MEFNLSDEENKKEGTEGGLRLSGSEESGGGLRLSGTGETGGGLRLAGGSGGGTKETNKSDNPWDFDRPEEAMQTISIASTVPDSTVHSKSVTDDVPAILKISQVALYVSFILTAVALIWVCSQEPMRIVDNLTKVQPLLKLMGVLVIVDIVLISTNYKGKLSLALVALFLNFLYPAQRSKYINGSSGLGGIVSLVYFLSVFAGVVCVWSGVSKYGAIIARDEPVRTAVMEVLQQTDEHGVTYEDIITGNCKFMDAGFDTIENKPVLVLHVQGNIGMADNNTFTTQYTKTVDTYLAFQKSSAQGKYELVYVQLGDMLLTSYGASSYWKVIQEN